MLKKSSNVLDLNVFTEQSRNNLDIIGSWTEQTYPKLQELPKDDLVTLYKNLHNLEVYSYGFLRELNYNLLTKLDLLLYRDVVEVLFGVYNLDRYKTATDLEFIQILTSKLTTFNEINDQNLLVNSLWCLSKINFHDQSFFDLWKTNALPAIASFNAIELTKSIQALATLRFFDIQVVDALLSRIKDVLDKCNDKTKVNIAFHLSMISVNNNSKASELIERINSTINDIVSRINVIDKDNSLQRQILQMHVSKVICLDSFISNRISSNIKKISEITTSHTQTKVAAYIERAYPDFTVLREDFNEETFSYTDIKIITPNNKISIEVDGPSHFFLNHQPYHNLPMESGATFYRNNLSKLNGVNLITIHYHSIDHKNYYADLLRQINEKLLELQPQEIKNSESLVAEQKQPITNTPQALAKPKQNRKTKNKHSHKKTSKNFDSILQKFKKIDEEKTAEPDTFNSLRNRYENDYNLKKGGPKALIKIALSNKNSKDLEIILQYYKTIHAQLDQTWHASNVEISYLTLDTINSIETKQKNEYLECHRVLKNYGYVAPFNPEVLYNLIYSFKQGDSESFEYLLNFIPENNNKKTLMEHLLIACGSTGHVDIVNVLLKNNIDLNICHRITSIQVFNGLIAQILDNKNQETITKLHGILCEQKCVIESVIVINSLYDLLSKLHANPGENPHLMSETTLYHSILKGHKDLMLFFLENGANIHSINNGYSVLVATLFLDREDLALDILKFKPKVDLTISSGLKAIHIAAYSGFVDVIKEIYALKGNLNARVCRTDDMSSSRAFLDGTPEAKKTFYYEETPLWIALRNKQIEAANFLIKNIDELDDAFYYYNGKQYTYLSYCQKMNYDELTEQLLIKTNPAAKDLLQNPEKNNNRLFSKPTSDRESEEGLEDSSTEPTRKLTAEVGFGKKFNEELKEQTGVTIHTSLETPKPEVAALLLTNDANHIKHNSPESIFLVDIHRQSKQFYGILKSNFYNFAEQTGLNWQLKKWLYYQDFCKYNDIKNKHGLIENIDIFKENTSLKFKKSVLLKLHTDKNAAAKDDFTFVINLKEKLNKPLDIKAIIDQKIQDFQPIIYKTSIISKALDITIDIVKLINEPTLDNAKKLALDSSYVYSMCYGFNNYWLTITADDNSHTFTQFIYMILPMIISYTNIPYLGFAYGALTAGYTGYYAVNNAYSLYQEYGTIAWQLKSAAAYKDLYEALANSPLQYVYDFSSGSQHYEIKTNNIKLEIEKSQIKKYLEEKGEFGKKLYSYIHAPMLEEKYNLLNKIISGELTEEQAIALKAKHVLISVEDKYYEHCMEVKNNVIIVTTEEYYCYNENQQILDHVLIGNNGLVEIIEML